MRPFPVLRSVSPVLLLLLVAALNGCGGLTSPAIPPRVTISGNVHGGQQPITAATVQLYAVGTTGDGSSATPLISSVVTSSDGTGNAANSNANAGNSSNTLPAGAFTITGDYLCPSSTTQVYLVAMGGNPGLAAGIVNPNIALMAALGSCGNLTPSTFITVNEVTTVASVASLASFTTGYAFVGSAGSDSAALQSAFSNVNQLVNLVSGTAPGPALPSGQQAPVATLNTLANILATCVNSTGGVAGDGSPCGQLFTLTTPAAATPPFGAAGTPPTDTVGAALSLILYPTQNLDSTLDLTEAIAPFQPTLSTAPNSWTVALTPIGSTAAPAVQWPAMSGLDMWLPFTDATGNRLSDVTGNGHDGTISGSTPAAIYPGLVGITPNSQMVTMPNASGRPSFGICAYFPAGGDPNNGGYFYGSAVGSQNGSSLISSYGPGNNLYHGANAFYPQIGRSNGESSTLSASGFSGIHCAEGIPGGTLDHIVVDGQEVPYSLQGQTSDVVGGAQLTAPMYLIGGGSFIVNTPVTTYSVWATTNTDSVAIAQARTSSELARLLYLGVPIGIVDSTASDSTCSIDGTSIDQGYMAGNVYPSTLLNLDFPCTIHDFSTTGQGPMDMNFAFQDRGGSVYHPNASRNIAYTGGVVDGILKYLEPPALAFQDIVNWNTKAHALGYKTIVSTMMSTCNTGYNGESGDSLAQQFNALLLANAAQFDWVDNIAAWPQLGATGACSGPYFVDGIHPNTTGQAFYVANERAGFEGVYGNALTTISSAYGQLPSDRTIQATGSSSYSIQLIDANSASFNSAGTICVQNTNSQPISILPVTGETIDGAASLSVASGSTSCLSPVVLNVAAAGGSWTANPGN